MRDEHGFDVPRDMVSKYLSLKSDKPPVDTKWQELLEQAEEKQYRAGGLLPPKFVAAVSEGIPNAYRSRVWLLLSGSASRMSDQSTGRGSYAQLLEAGRTLSERGGEETVAAIDRDLHRTFPGHPKLTTSFLASTKNILLAYSARSPEVAYCQGMNFVCAAILMFILDEESAFWMLCYVVEEVLIDHYVQSMIGHKVHQHLMTPPGLTPQHPVPPISAGGSAAH